MRDHSGGRHDPLWGGRRSHQGIFLSSSSATLDAEFFFSRACATTVGMLARGSDVERMGRESFASEVPQK